MSNTHLHPSSDGFRQEAGPDGRIFRLGEMADLISSFDWSSTAIGPISQWPETLIGFVNMILSSPLPMQLFWGPELVIFYNDAMIPVMADRHPRALGQPAQDCWIEAWPTVGPQFLQVRQTGQPVRFNEALIPIHRNGLIEDLFWDYSFSACFGPDGGVAGVLNIAQETTAVVHARRRLAASEARAIRILQSIGDGVIVTDAEENVTGMNPVAEELTGWREAEARGVPLEEVFPIVNETTRLRVENPAAMVRKRGTIVGLANHTVLIHRSGREIHIDDSGAPIRDEAGNLTGIVLVFRDIEERRAAERVREHLTSRLEQILEGTTDGVVMVDRDWKYTYINRAGREIAKVDESIIGRNIWEVFPGMVFENSPYVYHQERGMYEGISGSFTTEYHGGPELNVQVFVHPVAEGIINIFRDITEQTLAMEALMQTEKLAAVGRLASSIAHEINNPLEAVTNLLYLLRSDVTTPVEREQFLNSAEHELRRVSMITNQTLRFHKQSSAPVAVSMKRLVDDSLSVYHGRLANSGVTVERVDRAMQPVTCFDGEIRQVMNNLIGNAIDAMGQRGRLLIRTRPSTCLKTGRCGVTLTVADTGSGMSRETQDRIFQPFFTTKGIGGTGLGLWVSAEIVERHQGKLLVHSTQTEGRSGTVFTLFLPFEVPGHSLEDDSLETAG